MYIGFPYGVKFGITPLPDPRFCFALYGISLPTLHSILNLLSSVWATQSTLSCLRLQVLGFTQLLSNKQYLFMVLNSRFASLVLTIFI